MALSDKEISALYFEALGSQHLREQDRKMVTRFAHAVESEVRKQAGAVPLTDAVARNLVWSIESAWNRSDDVNEDDAVELIRATEAAHGIKGGQ